MIWKSIVATSLLIALTWDVNAQLKIKGGELRLKRQTLYEFEANAAWMIKWPNTTPKTYIRINWGDGSPVDSLQYTNSGCTTDSCITLYYKGVHIYPAGGTFTASVVDSFFIPGIVNIPNSSLQKLTLRQEINTTIWDTPPYTSFLGCLSGGVGCPAPAIPFNGGESDADGDSISYHVVPDTDIQGYTMPQVSVSSAGLVTFTANATPGYYNVRLKVLQWRKPAASATYSPIGASYRDLIFRVLCTDVAIAEQTIAEDLLVYPNPARTVVHLDFQLVQDREFLVDLTDCLGNRVVTANSQKQINLDGVAPGIYFLKFATANKQCIKKLVVQ